MMAKKRNNINCCLIILSAVATIGLCGCKKQQPASVPDSSPSGKTQPAVDKTVAVQSSTSSVAKSKLSLSTYSTSKHGANKSLDFTNRKDPFKPAIFELKQIPKIGNANTANPNALPIQRYEIEKFKITGIIVGLKENRALLVDPENKAYVARTGMLIGPNNGKIVRITSNSIDVEETFKDDNGRIKKRTVKLALQRKR